MTTRIAVKRLTASDLTFFEWQFRNHNAGNQKAINLNADVFIDQLYPALPDIASDLEGRIPLDLFVYGPGLEGEYNLQRKIIKIGSYKNWRLNGEFIFNPDESPERFNCLNPGDIAVLEFTGAVYPTACRAFFLAGSLKDDVSLHRVFSEVLDGRSMVPLSQAQVISLIDRVEPREGHPIYALTLETYMEEAAAGSGRATERLFTRPTGRSVTHADLRRARARVEERGREGEELVNAFLTQQKESGEIEGFEWVSASNAVSPYDFTVNPDGSGGLPLDAKSTSGEFSRPIHVSLNELRAMASMPGYSIYRVYEMADGAAKLRIAGEVREFAQGILEKLSELPEGITVDSVSVEPSILEFGSEFSIHLLDEDG